MERILISDDSGVGKKHNTSHSGQKTAKEWKKFQFRKNYFQLVQAAEEAAEAARSPTYANSCTVLPNLAGKCQILHFFGFFAHFYAHCA